MQQCIYYIDHIDNTYTHIISQQMPKNPTILLLTLATIILTLLTYTQFQAGNPSTPTPSLRPSPSNDLQITFKSISSILRTALSRIQVLNDTVFVGDSVGSVAIWNYDGKKKKLQFEDISRAVGGVLPKENKVVHLEAADGGVAVLTADGKLTTYVVNAQSKIIGNVSLQLQQKISWFTLIRAPAASPNQPTAQPSIMATINDKKTQLCIYQLKQSIIRPAPATKIQCNQSSAGTLYDHVSYDTMNSLISVGDETKAIIFKYNVTDSKPTIKYLTQANLPKVDTKGFKSVFANGTLLAINDLWISSILIDVNLPSARVISAQRTEKILKSGLTSQITAVFDPKLKKSITITNSKDKVQGYSVVNNKLTYLNDSKAIGRSTNFQLKDQSTLLAADDNELGVFKVGDQQEKDYLVLEDRYTIQSSNHFKPVTSMARFNNTMFFSVSQGGQYNVKLWTYNATNYKLTMLDQKTISFFSLLKQGIVNFLTILVIPPPQKLNAVIPYHIATSGADPFGLYIIPVTTQNKLGSVFRSKDSHYSNITGIFLSPDKKSIFTTSMDTTIKMWSLAANHDQVADNTTTILTKNGPIRHALQDKTGNYFVFAHCNTLTSKLANISIWKTDAKHGLAFVAQNVAGEAHQTNITKIVISRDEKYVISLSESAQIRLWRLENWTMVDLMASLSIGAFDATMEVTQTNKLLVQTEKFFAEYYFDQNGFILLGRVQKPFNSITNSSLISGNTWFSGDNDGSIRIYTFAE